MNGRLLFSQRRTLERLKATEYLHAAQLADELLSEDGARRAMALLEEHGLAERRGDFARLTDAGVVAAARQAPFYAALHGR